MTNNDTILAAAGAPGARHAPGWANSFLGLGCERKIDRAQTLSIPTG